MVERILSLFLKVRDSFDDVKEKVSLIKPYLELPFDEVEDKVLLLAPYYQLHLYSPGWAMKIEEFEQRLGFQPELIYESAEKVYAISILYRMDDEITTGFIAHEFAEIVAREKNLQDHEAIDRICFERGFGKHLLSALESDFMPGMLARFFTNRADIDSRIEHLKRLLS
ncbi:MAG: hypothetical protein OEW69_07575 [Nitrospirota bacterium]|nr:hypothetical protein [Nitrospirota bacterium]